MMKVEMPKPSDMTRFVAPDFASIESLSCNFLAFSQQLSLPFGLDHSVATHVPADCLIGKTVRNLIAPGESLEIIEVQLCRPARLLFMLTSKLTT
ncbi:MAG: hypothetical protein H7318_06015 [Oligoflexus sp.]|nr:hypothetical protein [Oligoflexus sp.]